MSWETAGTVTVTNNSATVTGAGTLFTAKSRVGDAFIGPDGRLYEITNIVSDFVLRISPKYLGDTADTQPYKIAPVRGYQKLSADRLYAVSSKIFEIGDTVLKLPQWLKDLDPTPVEAGGTGGTTPEEARANLGLKNSAVLDVGTEAGTVAAGDDSRLSDSREWIAPTVGKLEAEEGSSEERKAWTSLRVRQSTEAWWNNITGAFGRNLASSASIEDARSKLDISNLDNTSDTDKPVSSAQLAALNLKSNISDIVDNLASEETAKPLSAKQGKVLKQYIDTINTLLQSDDTNLDELQEIVDFIKLNRDDLDSLSIPSIAGLQEALDLKVSLSDNRLTDSREWIADTVGKLEAEEGTKNIRRAWSALRVKEAILARVTDGTLATGLEVANKVDKIPGKGLSDVNFTQVDKDKLDASSPVIVQTLGQDPLAVMSQKAVTDALNSLSHVLTDVYAGSYGLQWDQSSDTYSRIGSPGTTSIQSLLKRCTLNTDGTVNYFLHPLNSNFKEDGTPSDLSGADGNVMVQIPKFYFKATTAGAVKTLEVSLTPDPGFVLHPAFMKDGVEVDFRYYRAYQGTILSGKLRSVSGAVPTRSQTIAQFRAAAIANGPGWHQNEYNSLFALQVLSTIEIGTFNSQSILGEGNSTGANYDLPSGYSNLLGNRSSDYSVKGWMSYRGVENFYASIWEFIDGINISNRVPFISQKPSTFQSDVFTGDYVSAGVTMPSAYGFISDIHLSSKGIFPKTSTGSDSTFLADHYWQAAGNRIYIHGGRAGNSSQGGSFCLNAEHVSSYSNSRIGSGPGF